MPVIETKGAASSQGFGEFAKVGGPPVYIEDVMSTYLYTGNGSTQTITNGIDLSTYGGLVWGKRRDTASDHVLVDTARGATKNLSSNATYAEAIVAQGLTAFTSSGFTVGSSNGLNSNGSTLVSWTFRKQPKFFDVVTYTGDGVAGRTVAHSLGSVPGCIIIKSTDNTSVWFVYHRSVGNTGILQLQSTAATATSSTYWNNTDPTSTQFTLGGGSINAGGAQYVAYLFAHNAGGFGSSNADNVISCGSFTADGSGNATVNLGYEPQFIIQKLSSGTGNWETYDIMRGWSQTQIAQLYPNLSSAEGGGTATFFFPTATGFQWVGGALTAGGTYIYIAIRRGPMKTPTSGTSVFSPVTQAGSGTVTTNFPVDLSISTIKSVAQNRWAIDRLRGASGTASAYMYPNATNAEATTSGYGLAFDNNTGYKDTGVWSSGNSIIYWNFRRAPGFFDEVCFTGPGTYAPVSHNLGVAPQLIIQKRRDNSFLGSWYTTVYEITGTSYPAGKFGLLNLTDAFYNGSGSAPTSTVFTPTIDQSGATYVAYLFASCPGVSKVGSYTGNGTTQTINCGFTGGARFVLIKRTDASGDWYVYDTARGMTTLTDPYLLLNSTAAESATLGSVTTVSTGFALNASILAAINTNGASYIFLAIS